jgi:hypothetical protein
MGMELGCSKRTKVWGEDILVTYCGSRKTVAVTVRLISFGLSQLKNTDYIVASRRSMIRF